MDPLSNILSLVKIRSSWSGRFTWGDEWCVQFGAYSGIHSYAVLQGECWLSVEGCDAAVQGRAGDCLLLPSGRPFRVGSDLTLPAVDIVALRSGQADESLLQRYAGGSFVGIGGQFTFGDGPADVLTGILPAVLHIHEEKDKALLRWNLDQLSEELESAQPGSALVTQQLATMLLVQALRLHMTADKSGTPGWLAGLADRRLRAAITAIHDRPGHRWTVESLSKLSGMSRTAFAVRFKGAVGKAPLEYLTSWRMLLAAEKLRNSEDTLSDISLALGYESQSSFSTAFRRTMHVSPRQHAKRGMARPAERL